MDKNNEAPLPDLAELLTSARVVRLPMAVRFRGLDARETLLLHGPSGWSEFAPFPEYGDAQSATWLAAAIEFGWSDIVLPGTALAGEAPDRIRVNATIPAVSAAAVPDVLARFPGVRTAKVKVASHDQTLQDDIDRVHAVRAALGPEGRIRLDANGGWNVDSAEHAIHTLAEFDLEYLEQPCATAGELADIRARIGYMDIPVAADESIRIADNPADLAVEEFADLLVLKAAPLGGIGHAATVAAAHGLPAVVSSALESSVGISMGAHLAANLPDSGYDCGLGTAALLAGDITTDPLLPESGAIPVRRVDVDPDLLDRFAAPRERSEWWLRRLERCYRLLAHPDQRPE